MWYNIFIGINKHGANGFGKYKQQNCLVMCHGTFVNDHVPAEQQKKKQLTNSIFTNPLKKVAFL